MLPNPNLQDFWTTFARYRVLYGGRASSKTYDTCLHLIELTSCVTVTVLCVRQLQNKISDSVYSVLKKIILQDERYSKTFRVLQSEIINVVTGSRFIFYGIANERSLIEIKGIEADICFCEESEALTEQQFKIIDPTIRSENSFWIILFNPRYATDFVYKKFVINTPKDCIVRKINYDENPNLTDTMLKVIENAKQDEPENFEHIYLGMPLDDTETAVIPRKWIEASIDFELAVVGDSFIGYDVAVSGLKDSGGFVARNGNVIIDVKELKYEQQQATRFVYGYAVDNNIDTIIYDSIGVGQGASNEFSHLNLHGKNIVDCNVGLPADDNFFENTEKTNKEMFRNKKAFLWWKLRQKFKRTFEHRNGIKQHNRADMISIKKNEYTEKLIYELSTPLYELDDTGRIKIEKKENMLKRGHKSGNLADALVLSYDVNVINYANLI